MLHLYNKNKEKLCGLKNYKNLYIESELLTGDKTLCFTYNKNSPNFSHIVEEAYIRTKENEYVIKEMDVNEEYTNFKCILNLEDLEGNPFEKFESKEQSIEKALSLALAGTGWVLGKCSLKKKRTVRISNCSSLDIIKEIKKVYRVDLVYNTLTKTIDVHDHLGSDKGVYFIESLNLKKIYIQSNSYDFFTRIIPIGKDGLKISSINGGKDYIENYQYSKKVKTVYWKDDRYTVLENLKEDAIAKLDEISKPRRSYSVQILNLAKLNSKYKDILDFKLGDTILLISKENRFRDKQRIVKIIEYPENHELDSVELSNTKLSFEEIQTQFKEACDTIENITIDNGTVDGSTIDSITTEQISDFKANVINTINLNAINAKIQNLEAQNIAVSGMLTAVEAKIGTLTSNVATIDNLTVTHSAYIRDLQATKADITHLNAANATIKVLEANVGNIQTLVNGNLSSENIQTGGITSDKLTISNGFIKNAMIDSLDINKIMAGDISTNKFKITSNSGNMLISDNTIQIKDKSRVRVQIGKDAANDYNMYVWDADGNLMFDATGLKANGIKDKIIRNDMVADNANIDAHKLNIVSVVNSINNSSTTIKSSKVQIDGTNQTLDVGFNSLKTEVQSMQIGGRNLIRNSRNPQNKNYWTYVPSNSDVQLVNSSYFGQTEKFFSIVNTTTTEKLFGTSRYKLEGGATYTFSMVVNLESNVASMDVWLLMKIKGSTARDYDVARALINGYDKVKNKFHVVTSTITIPENIVEGYVRIDNNGGGATANRLWFSAIKLEKGNKATDWTPAPEDIEDEINSVKGITTSQSTTISVMQGQIATAINNTQIVKDGQTILLKDDYNKTTQTVESMKSSIGSHTTKIDQAAGKINSVETKVNSVERCLGNITARVSNTETKITKVNDKVDSIQIGSRNLARNTGNFTSSENWSSNAGGSISVEDKCIKGRSSIKHQWTDLKPNTTYMITLIFKTDSDVFVPSDFYGGHFHVIVDGQTNLHYGKESCVLIYSEPYEKDMFKKYIYKIVTKDNIKNPKLRCMIYHPDCLTGKNIWLKYLKVEKGTKATDWTPAPEDIEEEITNTKNKVSEIQVNLNGITSKVTNVETTTNSKLTNLETRLKTAEQKITVDAIISTVNSQFYKKGETDSKYAAKSQVTQLANQLSSKVDANGVKSLIQQNPNDVMIGFNGINNRININPRSMDFTSVNGSRDMSLYGGQLCTFNSGSNKFLATTGSIIADNYGIHGAGFLLSKHCNHFLVGRDPNWDDIFTNRSPKPTYYLDIDFTKHQIKLGLPLLTGDINLRGSNLHDANVGYIKDWFGFGWRLHSDGHQLMYASGHRIKYNVPVSFDGNELMNPKLYTDKLYFTNGHLAFCQSAGTSNVMSNGCHWDYNGFNIVNANLIGCQMRANYSLNSSSPGRSVGADTASIETMLLQEDFSSYDEENNAVIVNINEAIKAIYERNKQLENENGILKLDKENLIKELNMTKNVIDNLLMGVS